MAINTMRRPYLLILSLFAACTVHAELSLNPADWFTPEVPLALQRASDANEATANDLLITSREKLETGKLGSANRGLKKIIKNYPRTKAAGEALYLRGRVYMTKERWVKAFNYLQKALIEHPDFEKFDSIIVNQFDCATALMEGARGRILWVFPGFKQYGTASAEFEQIVRNAPYSDYAPLALMNIAILSERDENPEDAIDALDRLISYYPQNMLAPDAYFNLADTYASLVQGYEYDQGSTRQAISYYEDFLILFPQSSYAGKVEANLKNMENLLANSRRHLGDFFYYHRNNNTAALVFYNETITIAPESEAAGDAKARIKDIEAGVRPLTGSSILHKLLLAD
jgi:outer membrane protein assembly factor BamD